MSGRMPLGESTFGQNDSNSRGQLQAKFLTSLVTLAANEPLKLRVLPKYCTRDEKRALSGAIVTSQ